MPPPNQKGEGSDPARKQSPQAQPPPPADRVPRRVVKFDRACQGRALNFEVAYRHMLAARLLAGVDKMATVRSSAGGRRSALTAKPTSTSSSPGAVANAVGSAPRTGASAPIEDCRPSTCRRTPTTARETVLGAGPYMFTRARITPGRRTSDGRRARQLPSATHASPDHPEGHASRDRRRRGISTAAALRAIATVVLRLPARGPEAPTHERAEHSARERRRDGIATAAALRAIATVVPRRGYERMKRRRAIDRISRCNGLLLPPGRHVRTSLLR